MNEYSAVLQFVVGEVDRQYLDGVLEDLHGMQPIVETSPGGILLVQLIFNAADQRAAYMTALDRSVAAVNQVWRGPTGIGSGTMPDFVQVEPFSVELMISEEMARRRGSEHIPALISASQAAERLGVSRMRVNQMINEGAFATARRVGSGWVIGLAEIVAKANDLPPTG
jgi:hypothetical protein